MGNLVISRNQQTVVQLLSFHRHLMDKMKFCAALFTLFLSLTLAAQQPQSSPGNEAQANQQKARNILDRAIQAMGGQAYLNVDDLKEEGRTDSFYHGQSRGVDTLY